MTAYEQYRHQEFQFPLWCAAHLGTESEHQVLNGSHIFVSFTRILLLFGTKFLYSRKTIPEEEGKQSDKAAIRDLVLTLCPTMRSVQQRKLKLLMPASKSFDMELCGAREMCGMHQNRLNALRFDWLITWRDM